MLEDLCSDDALLESWYQLEVVLFASTTKFSWKL